MRAWIEKQRYIIDFTLSSLLRRKVKNLGLLALYTLIIFILASAMFFTYSIKKEASIILSESPEIIVQKMSAGRHDQFPLNQIERLKKIRGVAEVLPRLWGYYYESGLGANYTLLVPPVATKKNGLEETTDSVHSAESKEDWNTPDSPNRPLLTYNHTTLKLGGIIIGQGIARIRDSHVGDFMPFRTFDGNIVGYEIKGLLSSESELISSDLILITEQDFRNLFGISNDFVTDVTVSVINPREVATVASKIVNILPDSRPITREDILRTYESIFNWRGGMMIVIFSAAVLAFIIFAWDKASGLSAVERQEIGILKAIGWETSDVILMKFWEGAVISLTAFFTGVTLAYIHVFFTGSLVFEPALKGWSILYPHFALTPFISIEQLVTLFFITVIPYTVGTIVPTWWAATIDPDSAMRHSER